MDCYKEPFTVPFYRGKLIPSDLSTSQSPLDNDDTKKLLNPIPRSDPQRNSPYTLENICWIVAAFAVLYYTDFAAVLVYDQQVDRTWLMPGIVFISLFISIAMFITIYVSWYKKASSDDWDTLYPKAIPFATAFIVIGGFCMTIALWPVWGIFTPVVLFTLLMGVIVIVSMIP